MDADNLKRGGVAKWEGRGLQNRYERVRLPPPPHDSDSVATLLDAPSSNEN